MGNGHFVIVPTYLSEHTDTDTSHHSTWTTKQSINLYMATHTRLMHVENNISGWPQSRTQKYLHFPVFPRAIIILSQMLSQKVYVIRKSYIKGHSTWTTTHIINKSLSSYIAQIKIFRAPDTLGSIRIALHREIQKSLSIPGLWPPWICTAANITNQHHILSLKRNMHWCTPAKFKSLFSFSLLAYTWH